MTKEYLVKLDGEPLGSTFLEKADAPMGVVFGVINLTIASPYSWFREYCKANKIKPHMLDKRGKMIGFENTKRLWVTAMDGTIIRAEAVTIEGSDGDGYYVNLLGVPYPFYAQEFPHHVQAYQASLD